MATCILPNRRPADAVLEHLSALFGVRYRYTAKTIDGGPLLYILALENGKRYTVTGVRGAHIVQPIALTDFAEDAEYPDTAIPRLSFRMETLKTLANKSVIRSL